MPRIRLLAAFVVGVLVLAGCSGNDADEGPPEWVRSPPEYLSCAGMVDPRLVVELIRAGDLIDPDPEDATAEVDPEEPSTECHPLLQNQLVLGTDPADPQYMARTLSPPPDPLLVPIPELPGFVMHDHAVLYVSCTRGSETLTLDSSISIDTDELLNPRTRLAMARVLVDTTNRARDRFGCSERALSLPGELPEIPGLDQARRVEPRDGFDRRVCSVDLVKALPGYEPRSSGAVGEELPWVMETPQPSSLLSTCEIRVGRGGTRGTVPGNPKVAFVTYKGVLARARQESAEYSWPEYDLVCQGQPVSYRMYLSEPGSRHAWLRELPDDPVYENVLSRFVHEDTRRAGCPSS
ncbi:hypothetical protein [Actinopolyspora mortivallis]|uniref:hypothetical protein n=1 Tax=Actinopolyspora mortivallis TaxID=33906 RepID=UPI0003A0986F|nr:hypothetical protein [Actinopolyspora mortivallis]